MRDPGLLHARSHQVHALTRDDLRWTIAVPSESWLQPALIDWGGTPSPAPRLPDRGLRLLKLTLPGLPDLPPIGDQRIDQDTRASCISALFATAEGPRSL